MPLWRSAIQTPETRSVWLLDRDLQGQVCTKILWFWNTAKILCYAFQNASCSLLTVTTKPISKLPWITLSQPSTWEGRLIWLLSLSEDIPCSPVTLPGRWPSSAVTADGGWEVGKAAMLGEATFSYQPRSHKADARNHHSRTKWQGPNFSIYFLQVTSIFYTWEMDWPSLTVSSIFRYCPTGTLAHCLALSSSFFLSRCLGKKALLKVSHLRRGGGGPKEKDVTGQDERGERGRFTKHLY